MSADKVVSGVNPSVQPVIRDRVDVLTFGVGHGDCLLVEVVQSGKTEFRLLYDGGKTLPPALLTHLRGNLRDGAAADLDVVVLSHVDHDHQGGFHQLFTEKDIRIGEYWSPCLPAFERLQWLFRERVATAVGKARDLEDAALARGAAVIYPMENHVDRYGQEQAVTVSVISPARRLLKRLYTAPPHVIAQMLARTPLPLEWMIRGEDAVDDDNGLTSPFAAGTALSRQLLPPGPELKGLDAATLQASAAAAAETEGLEFSPEFFGNHVLNDTSLVIVLDVILDGMHRRRIVLSGDQENWSYISSQHPMGLAPDVLKVPHHGGRVHLWDVNGPKKDALPLDGLGQFFIWMRPRIAIVSAKGVHGLPRTAFREAVRMVGSTLVCPNRRSKEILFAEAASTPPKSCYDQFNCGAADQHQVLTLSLSAHLEDLDAAACLQGNCHRGPAPVVVMQQRLIEPDETFLRWTTGEVRKQARWLEKFLRRERQTLLSHTGDALLKRRHVPMTQWARIAAEAMAEKRTEFAADSGPVLRYAVAHGMAWSKGELKWLEKSDMIASLSEKEYGTLFTWLKRYQGIVLVVGYKDHDIFRNGDRFEALRSANLEPLMRFCAAKAGLEYEIFTRHVMPRLVRDMVNHFSARVVCFDRPFSTETWTTGKIMLQLYHRSTDIPDFLDQAWAPLLHENKPILSDSELEFILDQPVLAPFENDRKMLANPFRHFIAHCPASQLDRDEEGQLSPGTLPRIFNQARWTELWNN